MTWTRSATSRRGASDRVGDAAHDPKARKLA
jgi:hypothetical protein